MSNPPVMPSSFMRPVTHADMTNKNNPWEPFLGQPRYKFDTSAYERQRFVNYDLPEAYKGENLFLRDNLDLLVLSGVTFYTDVLLPMKRTDQLRVKWSRWEFNQHFTDVVPEEGVSRLIQSERREQGASFTRRGLALQMEHGFMNTPRGRENYRMNLRQIAAAVNETNNYGVIIALLEAPNYNREYEEKHGAHTSAVIDELMEREKFNWAILQRMKNGFEKMDGTIKQLMSRYQGQADTWIVPPEIKLYLTKVRPEKTDFNIAGPKGPKRVEDRVDSYVLFGNNRIYEARQYDVLLNGSADPLVRQRQIGECFIMVDRYADSGADFDTQHSTLERSIEIYDEEADDWARIGLKTALAECRLFDANGRLKAPAPTHRVPGYETDVREDFLTQAGPASGGPRVPVGCFGHILAKHTSARTVVNLARTLSKRVSSVYAKGLRKVNAIVEAGRELYDHIDAKPVVPAWFDLVFAKQTAPKRRAASDGRFWKSPSMYEWDVDPKTLTMELPDLYKGPAANRVLDMPEEFSSSEFLKGVLKGYGNWVGFKAMREEYKNGGTLAGDETRTSKGYPKALLKQASDYVKLMGLLTREMKAIMPDSAFLDERHTAPQYRRAEAESVVVENLFGMHGHALWYDNTTKETAGSDLGGPALVEYMDAQDVDRLLPFLDVARAANDADLGKNLLKIFGMNSNTVRLQFDGNFNPAVAATDSAGRRALLAKVVSYSPFAFPPPRAATDEQVQLRRSMLDVMGHLRRVDTEPATNPTLIKGLKAFVTFVMGKANGGLELGEIAYGSDKKPAVGWTPLTVEAVLAWMRGTKAVKAMFDLTTPARRDAFAASVNAEMRQAIEDDAKNAKTKTAPWKAWLKAMPHEAGSTTIDSRMDLVGDAYELPGSTAGYKSKYFRSPLTLTIDDVAKLADMRKSSGLGAFTITVSNVENPDTHASAAQLLRMAARGRALSNGDRQQDSSTAVASMYVAGSTFADRAAADVWQTAISHRIDIAASSETAAGDPTARRRTVGRKRSLGYTGDAAVSVGLAMGAGDHDRSERRKRMRTDLGMRGSAGIGSVYNETTRYDGNAEEDATMQSFRERHSMLNTMPGGRKGSQDGSGDDGTPAFNANFRAMYLALHKATANPLLRALGKIYLAAPVDRQTLGNFLDNDVLLPMGFLVLRPHQRYNMMMGIKMLAGKETGQTFHGHSDMQVSNNAHTKMHFGHYTYYSRSVVTQPKNVWIAHNIYARGTLGGAGIGAIKEDEYYPTTGHFGTGSVFYAAIPYEDQLGEIPNPLDVSGRLSQAYSDAVLDRDSMMGLHYNTAARYNAMWGWRTLDNAGADSMEPLYYDGIVDYNTVCWRSLTYYYDRATSLFTQKHEGTGHWGGSKHIFPGCRAGRRGELMYMDAVDAGALR